MKSIPVHSYNDLNSDIDYRDINARADKLEAEIKDYDFGYANRVKAEAAEAVIHELLDMPLEEQKAMTEAGKQYYRDAMDSEARAMFQKRKELNMYMETLSLQLVIIKTRYVVSDQPVQSPAGFHPDSQVYVQNPVMIHTDSLNMAFPRCNTGPLKAYEVNPI